MSQEPEGKSSDPKVTLMVLGFAFAASVVGGALSSIAIKSHPKKPPVEPQKPPTP